MTTQDHSNVLTLADILQTSALNRKNCKITVRCGRGNGYIHLLEGQIRHAELAELRGREAIFAMLQCSDLRYDLASTISTELPQTTHLNCQQVLLDAARRFDEESKSEPLASEPTRPSEHSMTSEIALAQAVPPRLKPRTTNRVALLAGASLMVGVLAAVLTGSGSKSNLQSNTSIDEDSTSPIQVKSAHSSPRNASIATSRPLKSTKDSEPIFASQRPSATSGDPRLQSTGPKTRPERIYDAFELANSDQSPPELRQSFRPPAPLARSISPQIMLRVLVNNEGFVADASVYHSRLDFAAYEVAALKAVRSFRFVPAQSGGQPVWAWIQIPVDFAPFQPRAAIRIKGSDTIGGALAPALAKAYQARATEEQPLQFDVESLGSSTAFSALLSNNAEIGASSRPIKVKEVRRAEALQVELSEYVLGFDGIAVIVHRDNPVQDLSMSQLGAIFSGKTKRWQQLGATPGQIEIISRPSYSGTHQLFRDRVLQQGQTEQDFAVNTQYIEHSEDIARAVASRPNAISYVGLGWANQHGHAGIRTVPLKRAIGQQAVHPEARTIRNGSYPLYRSLFFYTRKTIDKRVAKFLNFAFSKDGQQVVEDHGFIALDPSAYNNVQAKLERHTTASNLRIPTVYRIPFGYNSSQIEGEGKTELERVSRRVLSTQKELLVIGHADHQGSSKKNQRIAQARARAVRRSLIARGVAPGQIRVENGFGDLPIASNETVQGRAQNRRVDIYVLNPKSPEQ